MSDKPIFERIVVSRDVLHGKPRIAGTRITGVQVPDLLACIAYASQMTRDDWIVPTT